MTEIEELRSHLAGASPEALELARERLLAAQGRPASGGGGAIAPAQRHPLRPRRRTAIRVGGLALAVAAATFVALLVGIGSHPGAGGGPLAPLAPLAPTPADARTVLVRAAASAARADDGGIPRLPRPDEFFFVEIRGTYLDFTEGQGSHLNTRTNRVWQSETRAGRVAGADAPPDALPPARMWFIGNERFSHEELATFDPTPRELYERILHGISPGQGSSPHAEVFVQLVDALRQVPLAPRLRSKFLLALAEIPGLRLTGATKDALGRRGLGVAYVEHSREDQQHELILGRDGQLLAERATARDGSLVEDAVVVRQAITTDLEMPAG
jgi:hypothetical protein